MRTNSTTAILLTLLCITGVTHASVYKWVDDQGKSHFGDRPNNNKPIQRISIGKINTYTQTGRTAAQSVTIYTTTWCPSCKSAKRYFKQNNIAYTEYDVEKSAKGKRDFKRLKGRGVPIILVGKQRLNGFRASSFRRLYAQ